MKYKDIKMTVLSIIFDVVIVAMMIYFASIHDMLKLAICALLLLSTLQMTILKFKCHVFDDSTLIYAVKGILVLPELIKYQDIQSIRQLTSHKVEIIHKHRSVCCVFDGDAFYQDLLAQFEHYKSTSLV